MRKHSRLAVLPLRHVDMPAVWLKLLLSDLTNLSIGGL
jgi:hypothetical protein